MRILHIISALTAGGAEVYVRDLAQRMVRQGHSVCIVSVSEAHRNGRSTAYEDEFKAFLDKAGVEHRLIGHAARRRPLFGAARVRELVAEFRPDVIHAHLYWGVGLAALARTGVPLIYTHHNHRMGKGKHLYPIFNFLVDHYVGISRDCATALREAGANRIEVIYNGVDPTRLQPRDPGITAASGTVLTIQAVGGLIAQKNYAVLVDAVTLLLERRTDLRGRFEVRIAGEGILRDALKARIDAKQLAQHILLLGNRSDVPELLHTADLFVMSSDYEGLPIALLEALMTGLPVLVTDVGGCRDVVETCQAGEVVPPRDPASFSRALERLLDDAPLRVTLAKNARRLATRFDIEASCAAHLTLYRRLVVGPATRFGGENHANEQF
jgi:glycosyltransferase involved in cell wall biosynthesis